MHYDFIEIGTCDYHTIIEGCNNERGLSIEPIKEYLDKLPNKPNVIKINAAISDFDGVVDVFWVTPEDQEKGLSHTKGWGTIITPHRWHQDTGILSRFKCEAISWPTLARKYDVSSVGFVKIDTEGHDCIIVNSILSSDILPEKIEFERTHVQPDYVRTTVKNLISKGYTLSVDGEDMVFELCKK